LIHPLQCQTYIRCLTSFIYCECAYECILHMLWMCLWLWMHCYQDITSLNSHQLSFLDILKNPG
jgi:hypothetical protein